MARPKNDHKYLFFTYIQREALIHIFESYRQKHSLTNYHMNEVATGKKRSLEWYHVLLSRQNTSFCRQKLSKLATFVGYDSLDSLLDDVFRLAADEWIDEKETNYLRTRRAYEFVRT